MADLSVTSIADLDATAVQQAQEVFTAMLAAKYPELDFRRGILHDVVAFLAGGVAGAATQATTSRVLRSNSLLRIQTDPALADPELVDSVLSNVGISRKVGTRAVGEITVVVSGSETVVIAANAKYVSAGLVFRTSSSIVARPPGTPVVSPTDRVLTPRGDGSYSFTVPATAESVGSEYNIRANTTLIPDPVQVRFVVAFANGDFTGGSSTESNAELLERMAESLPAAVSAGRDNFTAVIKRQAVFGDTLHYAYAGFGDVEMMRDRRSIFPVSMGGCVDVYARTAAYPQTVAHTITATLQQKLATSSVWAFSVQRDLAPGFYQITSIRNLVDPADFSGFPVVSDVRGFDLSGDGWRPDIVSTSEAVYTPWQTAAVRFEDTTTNVAAMTVGDTREYVANFLVMPLLRELQDFLGSDAVRSLSSDILVRAAIPCLLSINATILRAAGESAPDLDTIRVALQQYVASLSFVGALYASELMDVIHNHLSSSMVVSNLTMQGTILRPDGELLVLRDATTLTIPESPSVQVTPRIAVFLLDVANIGLSVQVRS